MEPEHRARFLAQEPTIDPSAYISRYAVLLGDVRIGARASVWPGAVLRADINFIEIGDDSNVQDGSILHLSEDFPVRVGRGVTVGHRVTLHACQVEDNCLIGMGATILDGAQIGAGSIVGAHALVLTGAQIPPGSMVLGMPARVVRPLTTEEIAGLRVWAEHYVALGPLHRARELAGRASAADTTMN